MGNLTNVNAFVREGRGEADITICATVCVVFLVEGNCLRKIFLLGHASAGTML